MFAAALHLFKELPFSDPDRAASFGIAKVDVFAIRITLYAEKIYFFLFALILSEIKQFQRAFSGQILTVFTHFDGKAAADLEGFSKINAVFDAETGGIYPIVSR